MDTNREIEQATDEIRTLRALAVQERVSRQLVMAAAIEFQALAVGCAAEADAEAMCPLLESAARGSSRAWAAASRVLLDLLCGERGAA